jgi:hypothetical protein
VPENLSDYTPKRCVRVVHQLPTHTPKNPRLLVKTTLALLVAADFKGLASFQRVHAHRFARVALQTKHDFLRRLRLFVEHRFGLSAETSLLAVVTALACLERGERGERSAPGVVSFETT